jgi:hypothetical protein
LLSLAILAYSLATLAQCPLCLFAYDEPRLAMGL